MARISRFGFLAIAVVFHLIYIWSIFDIYFVSPIVSGMSAFDSKGKSSNSAPAKRLVLFVGDGLRADKAFQSFLDPTPKDTSAVNLAPKPLAPFLRSRVLNYGTFGVSHTRVPTESRPGHVALIAGLYEDVSAVTTGWKLNPVNFDSVFNRSRHTWSWGSPDILPMFKEGAVPGRIDAEVYGAEAEDFTQNAAQLDVWVFDKVRDMFNSAKQNATLDAIMREDKVVFFLHLIGLDTTGHAYRPYSKEYLSNIKVVDEGVEEITKLIESFYDDGKTAFVFTADHGMSDWGSHGDGHPDNTRTPLIAWGSGVARPRTWKAGKAPGHEDGFSHDWNLDHVQRNDVDQADVAALMAYLAGLEFPVNSVGKLPLPYLAANLEEKAHAALANTQEVLEMYRVKEEQKRTSTLRYRSFEPFSLPSSSIPLRVDEIKKLIDRKAFEDSIRDSSDLLQLGIDGLRYLQTYDWLFLRTIVTAGYLGWIAYALATIIDLHVLHKSSDAKRTRSSNLFFSSLAVILYSVLAAQKSSWTYYAYAVFPIFFWEEVAAKRQALQTAKAALLGNTSSFKDLAMRVIECTVFLGLLEALVQSYFRREIFTLCYLLAIAWPFLYGLEFVRRNATVILTWVFGCAGMSIFTLLPVVKIESVNLITYGGILMFIVGVFYIIFQESIAPPYSANLRKRSTADNISRLVMGLQVGMIPLAIILTRGSVASLQAKRGLPLGNQIVGWLTLVVSLVIPFAHRTRPDNHYLHRLAILFLTFSPAFVILTISYEGLFYFTFWVTVLTWVRLEHRTYAFTTRKPLSDKLVEELDVATPVVNAMKNRQEALESRNFRRLTLSDTRIALFFFFLLQSAFFSTGNIASLASFSLDSVYRLIPVFSPFSQGALLIFKLMIPFAIISANLGVLNRRLGVAPSALFMIVMAISDVMTLNFFYMVKDEGSWLDIGTTISHFCIASLLPVFVAGLEFVSEIFTSGIDMDEGVQRHQSGESLNSMNGNMKDHGETNGQVIERKGASIASPSDKGEPG